MMGKKINFRKLKDNIYFVFNKQTIMALFCVLGLN